MDVSGNHVQCTENELPARIKEVLAFIRGLDLSRTASPTSRKMTKAGEDDLHVSVGHVFFRYPDRPDEWLGPLVVCYRRDINHPSYRFQFESENSLSSVVDYMDTKKQYDLIKDI